MELQAFTQGDWKVQTIMEQGAPYFCGKDIAHALGYRNPQKAVRDHVFEEDRLRLEDMRGSVAFTLAKNQGQTVYINEAGVYALIFGSKLEAAKAFKKWVCQHILPRLRKSYQEQCKAPLCLRNETDLHVKVVQAIRRFYPHALLAPGLGELQDTPGKRVDAWRKGYRSGTPDILILNAHKSYRGFALEVKNPKGTGRVSEKQVDALESYRQAGFLAKVSDDYDAILFDLFEYFQNIRLCCAMCCRKFKTQATLETHMCRFHRC